jgi:hypothetical protein
MVLVRAGVKPSFFRIQELCRRKNVMLDDLSRRQKVEYIHICAAELFGWENLQGYAASQGKYCRFKGGYVRRPA